MFIVPLSSRVMKAEHDGGLVIISLLYCLTLTDFAVFAVFSSLCTTELHR